MAHSLDPLVLHAALMVSRPALVAIGLLAATGVSAQSRLATATSIRCSFPRMASEPGVKPVTFVLRFDSISTEDGTAQLKTGSVGSEVTVRRVEGYLHFMQAFRTGPLYTTTVFEAGATAGKFKAVHSRHEYFSVPLPGATSSPEQYYGECEVILPKTP